MTAVIRLKAENRYPIVMGDLLLSRRCLTKLTPMEFPTIEDTTVVFPQDPEWEPIDLKQKVSIIGERLAIGWAGNYLEAKDAITHLHHAEKNGSLTMDYVEHFLTSLGNEGPGFVGFLMDDARKRVWRFGYRFENLRSKHFEEIGFLGTGSDHVTRVMEQMGGLATPVQLSVGGGSPNIADRSIGYALGLASQLLGDEILTGCTMQESFGGGYEVAYVDSKNRFRKLDDICFAFWHAIAESGNRVRMRPHPFCVLNFNYTGDILTIRSLRIEPGRPPRHQFHRVDPLYRLVTDEEINEIRLPSLNSTWLCNVFLVLGASQPRSYLRTYCRHSNRKQCFSLKKEGGGVRMDVEVAFMSDVLRELQSMQNESSECS